MEVRISTGDNWKRHLDISLPSSEIEPVVERKLRDYQKQSHIDGFRKGKAPLQILDKIYGDAVRQKTIEELVPRLLTEACDQHQLHTVGPAKLDAVNYDRHTGLQFRATVEVEPEVELKKYSGFQLERIVYEVTDEDVAEMLERLREGQGWLESVEDGARPDHLVLADVQEVDAAGLPLIGQKFEDRRFQVQAAGASQDDFSPQLLGVKPGDSRVVRTHKHTPDGTKIDAFYRMDIKEVSEKKLPPLDDELAHDIGGADSTLEQLRKTIGESLKHEAEQLSREELRQNLIEEMLKSNPFDLPETQLEAFANAFLEDFKKKYKEADEQQLREEAHRRAIRYLKWRYLRNRVAELEHMQVDDQELRDYLAAVAQANNEDPQRRVNKAMNNEQERENLRDVLLDGKVLGLLESRTNVATRKVAYKDRDKSNLILV